MVQKWEDTHNINVIFLSFSLTLHFAIGKLRGPHSNFLAIMGGGGEGRGVEEIGAKQIALWVFENSQLQVELCPVTNQVAFYSAHVRLNGNKLDLKNVRYLQESGVYQCVAENRHGMIVSYTDVNVRGKHLENCIYTIEPSFPYYKSGLFLCFKMNQFLIKELAIFTGKIL